MLQARDRILFIGDSITNAFRMPDEISTAYQLGAGYALMVAGRYALERPGDGLEFVNRGVSGHGILQLAERWDEDCLALEPTVVSVLVGVNDSIRRFKGHGYMEPNEYAGHLEGLMQRTRRALPTVRFVICEPFLLQSGDVTAEWLADMAPRGAAAGRVAREQGAVFVSLQGPFKQACALAPPDYWAFDGIHPTAAGFALIAREWMAAVDAAA